MTAMPSICVQGQFLQYCQGVIFMCYIQCYIEVMPHIVIMSNQLGQFCPADMMETAQLKENMPGSS